MKAAWNGKGLGARLVLVLVALWVSAPVNAQTLVTNSKADNNIIYPGAVIGFNTTEALLTFNMTGRMDQPARPGTGWVYSIQATAKPSDGLGAVFSSGDLSPDATIKGAFGFRWGNEPFRSYAKVDALTRKLGEVDSKFKAELNDKITATIGDVRDDQAAAIERSLRAKLPLDKARFDALVDAAVLDPTIKIDAALVSKLKTLKDKVKPEFFKPHIQEHDRVVAARTYANEVANGSAKYRHRFLVYLDGSLRGLSFKRPGTPDTTNFNKSFYDEQFQGGEGRIGCNWTVGGRLLFGLSVGYGRAENKETLTKTEYTIRTTQTTQTQQLISEKKITAFAGDFLTFDRTSINFDLVWRAWKTDSAIIVLDPYVRHYISSDQNAMPDHTAIGLSLNFYRPLSGAFCGGLFIESGDVTNAVAKAAAEKNTDTSTINDINPFYKRLTFGLTVKVSLASISSLGG